MAHNIKIGGVEIDDTEDGIDIGDSEQFTLMGYPVVFYDGMSTEMTGTIALGAPLFDEMPRPTEITVSNGRGNLMTGTIEWRDDGDKWVGTIVWNKEEASEVK